MISDEERHEQAEETQASRREFLKSLGVSGLTLGALGSVGLALSGHVVRQQTSGGVHSRPWWVKTVDRPTTRIDWDLKRRFNAHTGHMMGLGWNTAMGEALTNQLAEQAAENEKRRLLEAEPGYTLKDQSLNSALNSVIMALPTSFLGLQYAPTPGERGVPRWLGSPEEAAAVLKAAMRHLGAASVGIVHLDENTRKLIYEIDTDGKRLEFADVDHAEETADRRIIPNRFEWAVVYTVQMSEETLKRAPTALAAQTTALSYVRGLNIQLATQEFVRGLGYQMLGEAVPNGLGIAPGLAVLAGLGELSRQNRVITPEYGPMVRIFKMLTDLPLKADKPIDAGIVKFCRVCKKCAEACPPGALSFATDPSFETVGSWNCPGHEAWFEDSLKCRTYWLSDAGTNCGICFAACPFAKKDRRFMHSFVKMNIANASLTDSVIRSMDDAMGYGEQKDPEAWWDMDLPEYGIDTTQGKK